MGSTRLWRNVDLLALALALPIFLVAGFPFLGWAGGAGIWLLQRVVRELLEERARRAEDPRAIVGLTAGSMVARGWLAALLLMGLYALTDAPTALAASVLFLLVFTFFLTMNMAMRPIDKMDAKAVRKEPRP
jgi:hypothetical protein